MATKNKMSAGERADREAQLSDVIFYALVSTTKEHAESWADRADQLREGLSKTAIKRAERRAHKRAEAHPPGFVKSMEAMAIFDDICRKYCIKKIDADTLWGAIAMFCMFQLHARRGPFFDAARANKLSRPDLTDLVRATNTVTVGGPIVTTCDCPNCRRERTAEELN